MNDLSVDDASADADPLSSIDLYNDDVSATDPRDGDVSAVDACDAGFSADDLCGLADELSTAAPADGDATRRDVSAVDACDAGFSADDLSVLAELSTDGGATGRDVSACDAGSSAVLAELSTAADGDPTGRDALLGDLAAVDRDRLRLRVTSRSYHDRSSGWRRVQRRARHFFRV